MIQNERQNGAETKSSRNSAASQRSSTKARQDQGDELDGKDAGSPGVLDDKGQPWSSEDAQPATASGSPYLPLIAGGAALVAGVGLAAFLWRRRRDDSLKARALRFAGSSLGRQIALGVGGLALGFATDAAKSALLAKRA